MTAHGYELQCIVVENGVEEDGMEPQRSNTISDGNDTGGNGSVSQQLQQQEPRLLLPYQYADTSLLSYSTQWKNHQSNYQHQQQNEQQGYYSSDNHGNHTKKRRKARSTSSTPIVVFGLTSYNNDHHNNNHETYLMACTSQGQILIWDMKQHCLDDTTVRNSYNPLKTAPPQSIRPWSMLVDDDDDDEYNDDEYDNDNPTETVKRRDGPLLTTSHQNEITMNRPLLCLQLQYHNYSSRSSSSSHHDEDHNNPIGMDIQVVDGNPNIVLYHCHIMTHRNNHYSNFVVCGDHGTVVLILVVVVSLLLFCFVFILFRWGYIHTDVPSYDKLFVT